MSYKKSKLQIWDIQNFFRPTLITLQPTVTFQLIMVSNLIRLILDVKFRTSFIRLRCHIEHTDMRNTLQSNTS